MKWYARAFSRGPYRPGGCRIWRAAPGSSGTHGKSEHVRIHSPGPADDTDRCTARPSSFQRAYMDFFSTENNRFFGNSRALVVEHLMSEPKPLMYGLFGAFGASMVLLSDAIELRNAVLVVESLVLAAVDWDERLFEMLSGGCTRKRAASDLISPETTLRQMAYDSRLGGLMKTGPGFHGVAYVLSSPAARAAVSGYLDMLDTRHLPRLLAQLARLSVLLLCATHRPDRPAFDFFLGSLPTLVRSLGVLLEQLQDTEQKTTLVRGVWLLFMLAYITQLRPRIDESLMEPTGLPLPLPVHHGPAWVAAVDDPPPAPVLAELHDGSHDGPASLGARCIDWRFLRAYRSIRELGRQASADQAGFYTQAADKLRTQWAGWTGLGHTREESLNIRL